MGSFLSGEITVETPSSFRQALAPLTSAQWTRQVRDLSVWGSILGSEGAGTFPCTEMIHIAPGSGVDLEAVVRMMPRVREAKWSWWCFESSDGVVRQDGIVAACAAAQEVSHPLLLSVGGCGQVCVSEGVAPSLVSSQQAFERLQALWAQRLQTLPGPCTVQLRYGW
jgi:hypothetical protein